MLFNEFLLLIFVNFLKAVQNWSEPSYYKITKIPMRVSSSNARWQTPILKFVVSPFSHEGIALCSNSIVLITHTIHFFHFSHGCFARDWSETGDCLNSNSNTPFATPSGYNSHASSDSWSLSRTSQVVISGLIIFFFLFLFLFFFLFFFFPSFYACLEEGKS